jgi:hypothetical protein
MALKSDDVTFKIPNYAILQFSKFEMLETVMKNENQGDYLWVDAGVSRFFKPFLKEQSFQSDLGTMSMIGNVNEALFEIDPRGNLRWGKLKRAEVGSCRRSFSGTSFLLKRDYVTHYKDALMQKAIQWVEKGIWDNEQIALNAVFLEGKILPDLINQKGDTGTIARFISGQVGDPQVRMYSSKAILPRRITAR